MVFVIMAFGGIFALFWLVTSLFAIKSKGERSVGIPVFWVLFFGAITGFGGMKLMESDANPEKILKSKYLQMKEGMTVKAVQDIIGLPAVSVKGLDEKELEKYDLTKNDIYFPTEITRRFSPGVFQSERKESAISLMIYGTESDSGEKNKTFKDEDGVKPLLGSSAIIDERGKQGHGLKGLQIRLYVEDKEKTNELQEARRIERKEKAEDEEFELPFFEPIAEENKEWIVEEGKDWEYTDGMKADEAAKAIAEAISKLEDFEGIYEVDEDALEPTTRFSIKPIGCSVEGFSCPEENLGLFSGDIGNKLRAQVKTGPNLSVHFGEMSKRQTNQLTRGNAGDSQKFFGGTDSAVMVFWYEEDPFIDDDFNTLPRLFVAAFVSNKLIAIGQNGLLDLVAPKPLDSIATGDMDGTLQRIIKGCEKTEYKKMIKKGFYSDDVMAVYKEAVKAECTPEI
jgi:hypothetical protein